MTDKGDVVYSYADEAVNYGEYGEGISAVFEQDSRRYPSHLNEEEQVK
ncbi:MAG TPA: hypothetical protein GX401_01560 [Clostridiales bacterium]|nr:hypothetical protein [Clostridiales bacterium]